MAFFILRTTSPFQLYLNAKHRQASRLGVAAHYHIRVAKSKCNLSLTKCTVILDKVVLEGSDKNHEHDLGPFALPKSPAAICNATRASAE